MKSYTFSEIDIQHHDISDVLDVCITRLFSLNDILKKWQNGAVS